MANFKYLSATFLALFLSLASCNNAPSGPTDPGNPGGGNPPGPVTTLETASITFSEYFADQDTFITHIDVGEFMLESSKGTNKNNLYPKYYSNGSNLRFYYGNTLTISGSRMTEIYFDASYNNNGTLTASVGSFDRDSKKWTGDATSVTFTVGTVDDGETGQFRVVAMSINQALDGDDTGGGGTDDDPPVPSGDHATFDFSVLYSHLEENGSEEFSSLSGYGLTISADPGTGLTPKVFKNGGALRLYEGNKLTVSGISITRIDFTFDTTKTGTFSASTGTMGDTTWTGNTNSLVLTVNASGQRRVKTMTIYAVIDPDDIPGGGGSGEVTLLSVFQDIVYNYTGSEMSASDAAEYWDSEYNEYGIGIPFGDTSEYTLESALLEAIDYSPAYLVVSVESHADVWADDGSDGYFATLSTEDGAITVDIGSYIEDGYVVLNVEVYEE